MKGAPYGPVFHRSASESCGADVLLESTGRRCSVFTSRRDSVLFVGNVLRRPPS